MEDDIEIAVPNPYIPGNAAERFFLKTILKEVVFLEPFNILGKQYEAYFTPGSSAWNEQGYFQATLEIRPKDPAPFSLNSIGDAIEARLWFEVDIAQEKIKIWWRVYESAWGEDQKNYWPCRPVLSAPPERQRGEEQKS